MEFSQEYEAAKAKSKDPNWTFEKAVFDDDTDDEFDDFTPKKRSSMGNRSGFNPNEFMLHPDDVTEAMLANVARPGIGKTRNMQTGTSCHQCRVKTLDTKTICRSGWGLIFSTIKLNFI